MTYTIFIEYKLDPKYRTAYLQELKNIKPNLPETALLAYEQLEATDQENLFVERLEMNTLEYYLAWKKQLVQEETSLPWSPIFPYIIGGKIKFNMWAFQKRVE